MEWGLLSGAEEKGVETTNTAATRKNRSATGRLKKLRSRIVRWVSRSNQPLPTAQPVGLNDEAAAEESISQPAVISSSDLQDEAMISSSDSQEECPPSIHCCATSNTKGSPQGSESHQKYIKTITTNDSSSNKQLDVSEECASAERSMRFVPVSPGFRRGDPTGCLQLRSRQWYWEGLDRSSARSKLLGKPDGTFLVRPTSDLCHYYAASVVWSGKVQHLLLKHHRGWWSFYDSMVRCKPSVVELIQSSMEDSKAGSPLAAVVGPVFLLQPFLRFRQVTSLQDQCGLVIQVYTPRALISELPLPNRIKCSLMDCRRH